MCARGCPRVYDICVFMYLHMCIDVWCVCVCVCVKMKKYVCVRERERLYDCRRLYQGVYMCSCISVDEYINIFDISTFHICIQIEEFSLYWKA